jgi:hypothetical protein
MQKLKIILEDNPFCSSPEITNLSNYLWFKEYQHLFRQHSDINFINLLLGYEQKINATTDLFKFIDSDSINQLRNGRTVLIFDATFEGYGDAELPLKTCLLYNAFLYNIDPAKIFLFTGNFLDSDDGINVIPIFLLDAGWDGGFNWNNPLVKTGLKNIDSVKLTCYDNFEKLVLSLSRRNRYYRVMAHFALFNSSIKDELLKIASDNGTSGTQKVKFEFLIQDTGGSSGINTPGLTVSLLDGGNINNNLKGSIPIAIRPFVNFDTTNDSLIYNNTFYFQLICNIIVHRY